MICSSHNLCGHDLARAAVNRWLTATAPVPRSRLPKVQIRSKTQKPKEQGIMVIMFDYAAADAVSGGGRVTSRCESLSATDCSTSALGGTAIFFELESSQYKLVF